MKKILITGKDSYIGTSFKNYLENNYSNEYLVHEISVKKPIWKELDFSKYDVILHVAGIAHIKETKENEYLYYKINRDLAIEVANKAKKDGVKQFIFLSTMSVYGINHGEINLETPTNPKSAYGKSKLEAEKEIEKLTNENFIVSILRPPMVYGAYAKGNYSKLSKLAKVTPIFPNYPNKRSMIFIDNLTLNIKKIIDTSLGGLFTPQNKDYINTSDLVKEISKINGNKVYFTKLFRLN